MPGILRSFRVPAMAAILLALCGCGRTGAERKAAGILTARAFDSGFPLVHDRYNGVTYDIRGAGYIDQAGVL